MLQNGKLGKLLLTFKDKDGNERREIWDKSVGHKRIIALVQITGAVDIKYNEI